MPALGGNAKLGIYADGEKGGEERERWHGKHSSKRIRWDEDGKREVGGQRLEEEWCRRWRKRRRVDDCGAARSGKPPWTCSRGRRGCSAAGKRKDLRMPVPPAIGPAGPAGPHAALAGPDAGLPRSSNRLSAFPHHQQTNTHDSTCIPS